MLILNATPLTMHERASRSKTTSIPPNAKTKTIHLPHLPAVPS